MASRIAKQITKQTGQLKKLMIAYNEVAGNCDAVSWDEVTNLESSFWLSADQQEPLIPRPLRLQAIALLSTYYRSVEELQLLEKEMTNVLLFHLDDYAKLTRAIEILINKSYPLQLHNGYKCLLKLRLYACVSEIRDCIKSFMESNPSFLTSIANGGYLTAEYTEILFQITNEENCSSEGTYVLLTYSNKTLYTLQTGLNSEHTGDQS